MSADAKRNTLEYYGFLSATNRMRVYMIRIIYFRGPVPCSPYVTLLNRGQLDVLILLLLLLEV